MALFVRMSSSIRSVFMCADPAQSVELGISLRSSTVNDVLYSQLADTRVNVKQVLQTFALKTNHRYVNCSYLNMGTQGCCLPHRSRKHP